MPWTYITARPAELTQAVFCVPTAQPGRVLVATNSYGDRINIDIHCDGDGWWRTHVRGSEPWMHWQPSPVARDLLVQLAG